MEKIRRTPFRCRGCNNRFYLYIPREKDESEESEEKLESAEAENQHSGDENEHDSDIAKPAGQ